MTRIIFKLCVLIWNCALIVSASTSTTPRFISYNSSDLSYLSNGIQFPVPETLEKSIGKFDDKVPTMQWLRQLYNHAHWGTQLDKIVDSTCKYEMETYIEAMRNESSWAIKMFDASGRYTTNFFYGNDFWLGSHSLCEELANVETNRVTPPFPVHFYAVKIRININENYTPVTRQIIIGQCLPKACNSSDLKSILLQEKSQAESLVVVDVRPVPGSYKLMDDKKFHIVGGVTVAVMVIILIATIVEIYLKRTLAHSQVPTDLEIQNNNNGHNGSNNEETKKKQLQQKQKQKQKIGKPLQILLSFSAYTNGHKILSLERVSRDSIRCIHGLRFFSIAWIILVHTYLEVFSIADNKTVRTVTERSFAYQTISNATFSVDTFFFISGLLVTITYFRSADKSKKTRETKRQPVGEIVQASTLKFLLMITYRFLRLTPAYLFVIGVNEVIARYTQSNSVFSPAMIDHITCDTYWWRNALYINNFYPQHEFCMLWSWYIANDTQFYVLATILLIIAVRNEKCVRATAVAAFTFLLTSWVTTFIIAMKYNYVARVEEPFALFDQLYDKPWLRIGPYLIGMATGYLLFKREEIRLPLWAMGIGWGTSLLCLSSVVYGIGREGLIVPTSAFYATFSHTAWGLSIGWIVVACCHGFGGPVDMILSFRGFLPLSRLTYCAYLIHPVIMVYTSLLMDANIHLFQLNVFILFMGNSVASFIVAFLISLFFEAPVVRLLKIMFGSGSKDD